MLGQKINNKGKINLGNKIQYSKSGLGIKMQPNKKSSNLLSQNQEQKKSYLEK